MGHITTCIILKTIFIIYIFITALHNTLPESVTNKYKKKIVKSTELKIS